MSAALFADWATLVFAAASMLTVGLSYTVAQILAPFRDGRAVLRSLLANFFLVPLFAMALIRLLDLSPDTALGLLLLATAAGAPFMIRIIGVAGGDLGAAAGLLVMLVVSTLVIMPLVVPLIGPGVSVDAWAIARPLLVTMLLPLAAGLVVDAWRPELAARLRAVTGPLSSAALLVLVGSLVALNLRGIVSLIGVGSVLAAVAFPLGAFGIGWLLERRGVLGTELMAFGTAQRNVAAALVVATQDFERPGIALMIVFVSLVTLGLLFGIAKLMGSRRPPSGTATVGQGMP